MAAASLLLRQSNLKLQEELRKTNSAYSEEKAVLRSQLSSLRLDLSQLHHDDHTVTSVGESGHTKNDSVSLNSESPSRRSAEFDTDSERILQLPSIKNLNLTNSSLSGSSRKREGTVIATATSLNGNPRKCNGANSAYSFNFKQRYRGGGGESNQSNKSLRFIEDEEIETQQVARDLDATDGGNINTDNNNITNKQESQKFIELQKNQEVLRSIGRANLKERRYHLIRLPTISSAKKRTPLWDSGNYSSRPAPQSTSFEENRGLYVKDSVMLSKRAYKIPSIKDSQRSEINLSANVKRPEVSKRKVQFTRPQHDDYNTTGFRSHDHFVLDTSLSSGTTLTNESANGSLNNTLADASLEDNTMGNITFDEETFHKQMAAKARAEEQQLQETSTSSITQPKQLLSNNIAKHNENDPKNSKKNPNSNNHNTSLASSSGSSLKTMGENDNGDNHSVSTDEIPKTNDDQAYNSCQNNNITNINTKPMNYSNNLNSSQKVTTQNNTINKNTDQQNHLSLPPIKVKSLAKKNLIQHDLNNMRTSPTNGATVSSLIVPKLPSLSPEMRSVKDSNKSVRTKLSQLSHETKSWKNTYSGYTDPAKRNKTLTEIMFAVRARMRENEDNMRFGQTPRFKDRPMMDSSDIFMPNSRRDVGTPRWSDGTNSPRKGKISKRSRPTIPPTKAEKSTRRNDTTSQLQGYLRKMYRNKRISDDGQEVSPRRHHHVNSNIHKQPRLVAGQA